MQTRVGAALGLLLSVFVCPCIAHGQSGASLELIAASELRPHNLVRTPRFERIFGKIPVDALYVPDAQRGEVKDRGKILPGLHQYEFKGYAVSPIFFRGTFALVDPKSKKVFCTATFVGPNTIVTAAHCVKGGRVVGTDGRSSSNCVTSEKYQGQMVFDYALCKLSVVPGSVVPEIISTSAVPGIAVKEKVLLAGFGCRSLSLNETDVGTFRVGEAKIASIPADSMGYIANLAFSKDALAAVCGGDSGGPVFKLATNGEWSANRLIAGLMVKYDPNLEIRRLTGGGSVVLTSSADFKKTLDRYLKATNGETVCTDEAMRIGCNGPAAAMQFR